ncbi:unnamed protein product [Jaminaea pallidilutea]
MLVDQESPVEPTWEVMVVRGVLRWAYIVKLMVKVSRLARALLMPMRSNTLQSAIWQALRELGEDGETRA